mgnify:CR=1 FL=1
MEQELIQILEMLAALVLAIVAGLAFVLIAF